MRRERAFFGNSNINYLLAASLFRRRRSQYESSFLLSGMNSRCFRDEKIEFDEGLCPPPLPALHELFGPPPPLVNKLTPEVCVGSIGVTVKKDGTKSDFDIRKTKNPRKINKK